jgi:hypothetical protein
MGCIAIVLLRLAGLGYTYGVNVGGGDILVEANIFDYNRHSFSGDGDAGEKAEVRYNIHLGHGYYNGGSHFDVHENQLGEGIFAGDYYLFHHNTVVDIPGHGRTVEPAFHIRENPATGAYRRIGAETGKMQPMV